MILLATMVSIFKVYLVEDGEDLVVFFIFVRHFNIVAELEGGTHITPLVYEIPMFAEESPITIYDGCGPRRNF